jgi:Spy/CpxP family protein refolding chaperone
MKALILILLAASYAAAQNKPTIADIARQERARRAESAGTKVYTMADIKTLPPSTAPEPGLGNTPAALIDAPAVGTLPVAGAAPAAGATPATAAATPETPKEDPVQKWLAETEKLRAQLRQLIDQESATQLEINQITNRIYTPVTSVSDRDRAQNELGIAQVRLQALRDQITKARAELQTREQEGPPKKQ